MPQIAELFKTMSYGPAPESDAAAIAWLDSHQRKFDLFINNAWVPPAEGNTFTVSNPARDETLAQVADAGAADIDAAVKAARAAFTSWNALTPISAPAIYTRLPAMCRSTRVCWRWWKAWITANQSENRAILISR